MTILSTLETWQRKRIPLEADAAVAGSQYRRMFALGRMVTLHEKMAAALMRLGFPRDGYSIPSAIALVRSADSRALPLLATWRDQRAKLDVKEMALPSTQAREPVARVKSRLDARMARELAILGVPVAGLQIDAAIAIIEAVLAERTRPN